MKLNYFFSNLANLWRKPIEKGTFFVEFHDQDGKLIHTVDNASVIPLPGTLIKVEAGAKLVGVFKIVETMYSTYLSCGSCIVEEYIPY